ncbi:hypothetical protein [Oceanobacillus salinisoli]|uniref:hypothetical protein n=1 Tax=Oceanobacillus salinisoli TaxID=2678611 RepID=UPI0012E30829|nr:hypothetical protein [Oceanobacillus salinisoli]
MDYEKLFRLYKGFLKAENDYSRDVLKDLFTELISNKGEYDSKIPIEIQNLYIEILQLYGEIHKHEPDIEKSELEEQIHLKIQEFNKLAEQIKDKDNIDAIQGIVEEIITNKQPKYSLEDVELLIQECLDYLKFADTDEEIEKRADQYYTLREYKKKHFGGE